MIHYNARWHIKWISAHLLIYFCLHSATGPPGAQAYVQPAAQSAAQQASDQGG